MIQFQRDTGTTTLTRSQKRQVKVLWKRVTWGVILKWVVVVQWTTSTFTGEPAFVEAELGSQNGLGQAGDVVQNLADDDDDQRHTPRVQRIPNEASADAAPALNAALAHVPVNQSWHSSYYWNSIPISEYSSFTFGWNNRDQPQKSVVTNLKFFSQW